jgi:hypothetical protein
MRHSNHAIRAGRPGALVLTGLLAVSVAACGPAVAPSVEPTARPTPVITPDPHLTEPVTADEIFVAIGPIDLPFVANNASPGREGDPMVKRINADLGNWPLIITEFRSSAALRAATGWDASRPPVQGDPPFAFVGLNILVEFGPSTGVRLDAPDPARQEQAKLLVAILDPLLWPLEQRSVVPVPTRTPVPASPAASAAASPAP